MKLSPTQPLILEAHRRHALAVAFTPAGDLLLSAGLDSAVRIWSTADWSSAGTLVGPADSITGLQLNRQGTWLLTTDAQRCARLWSLPERRLITTLEGAAGACLLPDGRHAVLRSAEGRLSLCRLPDGAERETLPSPVARLSCSMALLGSHRLLLGCLGALAAVDLDTGALVAEQPAHGGAVLWIGSSPTADRIFTTGVDRHLRVWDSHTLEALGDVPTSGSGPLQGALRPDGGVLALAVEHGVHRVALPTGSTLQRLPVKARAVFGLAYDPRGRWLAAACGDGALRIWEATYESPPRSEADPPGPLTAGRPTP